MAPPRSADEHSNSYFPIFSRQLAKGETDLQRAIREKIRQQLKSENAVTESHSCAYGSHSEEVQVRSDLNHNPRDCQPVIKRRRPKIIVPLEEWQAPDYSKLVPDASLVHAQKSIQRKRRSDDSDLNNDQHSPPTKRVRMPSSVDCSDPVADIVITASQLLDSNARMSDVLRDIELAFPLLSPHLNPDMSRFPAKIDSTKNARPTYPVYGDHSASAPTSADPALEELWTAAVKEEPVLAEGSYHSALDMDRRLIVKPWDSLNGVVVSLTSYPVKAKSLRLHDASIWHMANPSVGALFTKIGYSGDVKDANKAMLAIDLFPRRIDREDFKDLSSSKTGTLERLKSRLPSALVKYWETVAMKMWHCATAPVGILWGSAARNAYENSSRSRRTPIAIADIGHQHQRYGTRPWCYLEYTEGFYGLVA
ncbi:hypothetical protein FB567DRAFT_614712 [Paraphoma chrysanthemicola]|uniref:Uncharacterized protein n=1 Tax=Paraphoma chrysanthemicola TaxID=798071 RepID=A0A8K0RH42_9PLEO|nr:hypothetical protein FB567DRAFT_614712 [Paraphoma chrysanthemicola]